MDERKTCFFIFNQTRDTDEAALEGFTRKIETVVRVLVELGCGFASPDAISRICSSRWVEVRRCIDRPVTRQENRRIATDKYAKPRGPI